MDEETTLWVIGGLGAALLWMSGFGLGDSLSEDSEDGKRAGGGLTGNVLLAALIGFAVGIALSAYAAFYGPDLPLVVGVVGAVVVSALGVFR